ncbi:fish-egg lectin-like [Narcine bancroftii]|uniref:fish-egg lectin-like n=1 Tax=Narcine bancroftii TaxID=1343680 RepID=UPI0038317475
MAAPVIGSGPRRGQRPGVRRGANWRRVHADGRRVEPAAGQDAARHRGALLVFGAVGPNQELYRLVEGKWAILAGLLSQIDAGGDQIVVGVDKSGDVFCSNHKAAVSARSFLSPAYAQVPGKLKYYACGPRSCWGVSHSGVVSVRLDITRNHCMGEKWLRVRSRMVLVEVGTDGSVYALNHSGFLYRRLGITRQRPEGTQWKRVDIVGRTFRHVTADLGALWLIEKNNDIVHCQ